ncbi:MAG: hypothetical protein AAFR90_10755 [Pseudomonadota bacterium]
MRAWASLGWNGGGRFIPELALPVADQNVISIPVLQADKAIS